MSRNRFLTSSSSQGGLQGAAMAVWGSDLQLPVAWLHCTTDRLGYARQEKRGQAHPFISRFPSWRRKQFARLIRMLLPKLFSCSLNTSAKMKDCVSIFSSADLEWMSWQLWIIPTG